MSDCPFCAIAAGDASAHVLHEDDHSVAFLDSSPARDGHALVIPKRHVTDLFTDDRAAGLAVFQAAQDVASALQAVLDSEGFSAVQTTGDLVGSVEHAHLHLIPRDSDDGVSIGLPRGALGHEWAEELVAGVEAELGAER
jgi:histidine triad (HIT) family protein